MSESVSISISTACYHCGEDTGKTPIRFDDKPFCCEGCKVVYSLLQDHNLCDYYALNEAAGISFKNRTSDKYDHLDQESIRNKLLDFTDGKVSRVHFYLPNIHCSSCLWLLENLYKLEPGISHSRVNFLRKEVSLVYHESQTTLRKIVELLSILGYPPILHLGHLDRETKPKPVDKSLYYKIGLAGFAFGNIMLLSFPEYLGLNPASEASFARFFGYLNILLSLPVVLYSSGDYLRSAWIGLRQGRLNIDVPVSIGILALFGRSVYEILTHTGPGFLDSLAGFVFFLLIGKWFQQKIYHTISFEHDYKSYFPMVSTVLQGGEEVPVALDALKEGDRVLVRHGELIPADAILMSGEGRLDYSFVTGESEPVTVLSGEKVFAGGRQMGTTMQLEVIGRVSQSYLTSLWNEDIFDKGHEKGMASKIADKVAVFFTILILTTATLTLLYWIPRDSVTAFNAFTAVLIIACPCAVALAIPFTFGNAIRILGKNRFFLKNVFVLENLTRIKAIVFDKTGTITHSSQGQAGYFAGEELDAREKSWIRTLVHQSSHPVSRQIESLLIDFSIDPLESFQVEEGKGIRGVIDGHVVKIGSRSFIGNGEGEEDGTWILIDGKIRGYFRFKGLYREDLQKVISGLPGGTTLSLLSGDNAREKEIVSFIFGPEADLRFDQSPRDKLHYVKDLQDRGKPVLMVGDGLNDAGALKQSDVGIVITDRSGNFVPACDAVLDGKEFRLLPKFLKFARYTTYTVLFLYIVALIYNIVGLNFAVKGQLSPVIAAILMPLSSMTIVVLGTSISSLLAQRLELLHIGQRS